MNMNKHSRLTAPGPARAPARGLAFALALALALPGAALPAGAACFADYKAKRDNPLRLHYGVVQLPDDACGDPGAARAEIARRLQKENWTLLIVLGIFGADGLDSRRTNAGEYFLRF